MQRSDFLRIVCLSVACAPLASCRSPLDGDATSSLRASVLDAIRQDLASEADAARPVAVRQEASDLNLSEERLDELNEISGVASYEGRRLPLGQDLVGDTDYEEIEITLADAIASAVNNNLRTQAARLEPAIRAEDAIAADAVFDWTLFASAQYASNENPTAVPVVGGVPVGVGVNESENTNATLGVDKQTRYGGFLSISTTADVFNNQSEGFELFPDPSRTADLDVVLSQPLLEGFGYDVNMAQVFLAQNNTEAGVEFFRRNLMDTITEVENAYWRLYLARQELLIRERLLQRGVETRDALEGRLGFDVKQAQVADAVATVEFRRADLTRTRNNVRSRSDELKALLNDPEYPLGDERMLAPIEAPLNEAIQFSLLDAITSGVTRRPEIRLAEIDIRDADIRRRVAENSTLPLLNLDARFNATGLDDDLGDAYSDAFSDDFYDSAIGLSFEQPIGNRGPESALRRARLQRVQAVTLYRASVEDVILDIKTALRNVATNYQLIAQTRVSRLAAAENLRTLQAEEETIRSLTPEFLDLKLRRQESLALAEFQEIQAVTDYTASLAQLYRAMGVTLERNGVSIESSVSLNALETEAGF